MPVSQDYRDSFYPPQSAEAEAFLLVLDHEDWAEPLRLTDILRKGSYDADLQAYTITVGADVYYYCPFSIAEPNRDDESPRGKITIPNVNSEIAERIDALSGPVTATLTPVLKSDPTIVLTDPYVLMEITAVTGDRMAVSGEIGWPKLTTEPYPWEYINDAEFVAAFRYSQ